MTDPILDQRLRDFELSPDSYEVEVPGLSETIFLAPSRREKEFLMYDGIKEGRIWTARELRDLCFLPGITHEEAVAIASLRIAFNASIENVRFIRPRR